MEKISRKKWIGLPRFSLLRLLAGMVALSLLNFLCTGPVVEEISFTKVMDDNPTPGDRQFSERINHNSIAFLDQLFVMGGGTETSSGYKVLGDVWISLYGGTSWYHINKNAPEGERFPARERFASAIMNRSMIFVLGGNDQNNNLINDVWFSESSGISWRNPTSNTAPESRFPGRSDHTAAVIGETIYVLGGNVHDENLNPVKTNDVWVSSDWGVTWSEVKQETHYPPMAYLRAVVRNGSILLLGGADRDHKFWGDVWESTDGGTNWNKITEDTPGNHFPGRIAYAVEIVHDQIYVMGGQDRYNGQVRYLNDVWISSNGGRNWRDGTPALPSERFTPRMYLTSGVVSNQIHIMGGMTLPFQADDTTQGTQKNIGLQQANNRVDAPSNPQGNMGMLNDVWRSNPLLAPQ